MGMEQEAPPPPLGVAEKWGAGQRPGIGLYERIRDSLQKKSIFHRHVSVAQGVEPPKQGHGYRFKPGRRRLFPVPRSKGSPPAEKEGAGFWEGELKNLKQDSVAVVRDGCGLCPANWNKLFRVDERGRVWVWCKACKKEHLIETDTKSH